MKENKVNKFICCRCSFVTPGKHISLSLQLKSMTGSKTVVNVPNRFGHCAKKNGILVSYDGGM